MTISIAFTIAIPSVAGMAITGLPDVVHSGTTVKLTCSISRIQPEALEFYWTINGQRINGSIDARPNKDGASLMQRNILFYR